MRDGFIIGVDFDGTVVKHEFPKIGKDVPGAVDALKTLVESGARLVLFTMRSGDHLDEAVEWFAARGIPLWGVNRNPDQDSWTTSPKAYCHIYIDDAALGCPLLGRQGPRAYVNWPKVMQMLSGELLP